MKRAEEIKSAKAKVIMESRLIASQPKKKAVADGKGDKEAKDGKDGEEEDEDPEAKQLRQALEGAIGALRCST